MILPILQMIFGVLLVVFALMNNTKNVQSAMIYKVLPLSSGAVLSFSALIGFGVI